MCTGFEPVTFCVTGRHPRPLDQHTKYFADTERLELSTSELTVRHSNQLSYVSLFVDAIGLEPMTASVSGKNSTAELCVNFDKDPSPPSFIMPSRSVNYLTAYLCFSSGDRTRTCDLLVMSQASYQLLYSAI